MKRLENKSFSIKSPNGQEIPVNYFDLARQSVNNPPQQGFTPKDMRDRMRILVVLDNAKEDVANIEDADVEVLKKCVNEMRWAILSQGIVDFCDKVDKL